MTFTVASNSFKDGDYLPRDFILSSDFGFGCAGRNRSPHLKWSGAPCPPEGDHPHRYLFTVFAVKIDKLDVKADTSAAVVGFNLHFNTLAKAEIMGLFKR
jgi:Raf kinase inhibitor-like YbhB/YbcL family protein